MRKISIIMSVLIAITIKTYAQIPNNGVENWTSMGSYYNPELWSCLNETTASTGIFTCERGTPGHPGSYYLKLTSRTVTGIGVIPGIAVSGIIDQATKQPLSGFAFSQRPTSLTGSWQHMISGSSQGYIDIQLTRWDNSSQTRISVASVHSVLSGMAMSWSNFTIPITYIDVNNPDSCIITLSASGSTPANNDYLYVDNLAFTGLLTGISNTATDNTINLYPNPASDLVTLSINNVNSEDLELNIYTVTGILVKSEILKPDQQQIHIGDLINGIYMVAIKSKNVTEYQTLCIQR